MTIGQLLSEYGPALLRGMGVTLRLCALVWLAAVVLGWPLGLAAARWKRALGWPVTVASVLLAATPTILLLYYLHFPVQAALGIVVDPFYTAAAALSVYAIFGTAQVVRHAYEGFPRQYLMAARACGLSARTTALRIKIPLLLRHTLPGLLTVAVIAIQSTLFAAYISVEELFRTAMSINAREHSPVLVFSLIAIFFVAICLPLHLVALVLSRRYAFDTSEK